MKIAIRTDASTRIGTGHVMRCLTLADELRERGAEVSFVCRALDGNLIDLIRQRDFAVTALPASKQKEHVFDKVVAHAAWLETTPAADARETIDSLMAAGAPDWLVVDHYALDKTWERQMRPHVGRIMAIDDLADRHHDCDLLLDQNYYRALEGRYDGLVPAECRLLLGPKYALLRKEFSVNRNAGRRIDRDQPRLLVMFGGCDATGETLKTLQALELLTVTPVVDIVVGPCNRDDKQIIAFCSRHAEWQVHQKVTNMAVLMSEADIAVGAAGTTTWERACMDLPTVIISVAENQRAIGEAADGLGLGRYLGPAEEVTPEDIVSAIEQLLSEPRPNPKVVIDGRGAIRVCEEMMRVSEAVAE